MYFYYAYADGQRRPIGIYEANTENNFVGVEKLQLSEFKCLNASDMCSVYLDPLGFFMWKGKFNAVNERDFFFGNKC